MNRSIDSLLGLNHSTENTNDLNNSDLSKKIFILNKLIEKNNQSFKELESSKLRTERMFNELKRTRNRAENDIKLFQELSKEFTNTLDKEHEINLSDALEYQDINYNFSTTEKEDFLSSNLKDLISNLNFIPIDVVGEVSCGTPSYAFNEISNEATCKKIHKKKDKLELHPCSTLPYEIQYYDKNSDINIIGVVLGSLTDILDLENIDIEYLEEKLNTI